MGSFGVGRERMQKETDPEGLRGRDAEEGNMKHIWNNDARAVADRRKWL
jgi:hypothetical protein